MNGLVKTTATAWLVLRGFSYRTAGEYLRAKKTADNPAAKRIMGLLPLHKELDKLFEDLLTTHHVLWELRRVLPEIYGVAVKEKGRTVLRALPGGGERRVLTGADVTALARRLGALAIRPGKHELDSRERILRAAPDGSLTLDGAAMDENSLAEALGKLPADALLTEYIPACGDSENAVYHVSLLRGGDGEPRAAQVYRADHTAGKDSRALFSGRLLPMEAGEADDAAALAEQIGRRFAEAPYLGVAVIRTDRGLRLWQVDMGRDLAVMKDRCPAVEEMLRRRARERRAEGGALKRIGRYAFALRARRRGFLDYMYRNWLRGLKDDNKLAFTTAAEKKWAHERGYYSYRIGQYGLTEENWRTMLSDYDYKRLRPINGKYQKWLWDKISTYYVMAPFRDCFPAYYFRTDGGVIYPFGEKGGTATADDVLACLRREGKLAAKPAIASHGDGFLPMTWENGRLTLDGRDVTEEEFRARIGGLTRPYLISEFVEMHPELKKLYDKVACSVRIMVIDRGAGPRVEHAYFRIASSKTGNTDNLATGGIVARVNAETGEYDGAEMLVGHKFRPCATHPDSGAPLRGTLPNWELVRRRVCEVTAYLTPMEYLGFDIVITADGLRILEINTHQDLHRYPEYPQSVKDYLLGKRDEKGRTDHV